MSKPDRSRRSEGSSWGCSSPIIHFSILLFPITSARISPTNPRRKELARKVLRCKETQLHGHDSGTNQAWRCTHVGYGARNEKDRERCFIRRQNEKDCVGVLPLEGIERMRQYSVFRGKRMEHVVATRDASYCWMGMSFE